MNVLIIFFRTLLLLLGVLAVVLHVSQAVVVAATVTGAPTIVFTVAAAAIAVGLHVAAALRLSHMLPLLHGPHGLVGGG